MTSQDRRPTFMYHKGNRESMDCMDDIVLIQASGVEHDSAIQDLKVDLLHAEIFHRISRLSRRHVKSND